jgi:phage repressor protein C with HTH and peptisase S24 domain
MDDFIARQRLESLIQERREDYASLSRLIGRNPAYIQQFIKRGVPRRLAEDDRRVLAHYFGVEEGELGGPASQPAPVEYKAARVLPAAGDVVLIPQFSVGASAGPGTLVGDDPRLAPLPFQRRALRRLTSSPPSALSVVQVSGDSMFPTLSDGDDILVDNSDGGERLRDGIYVLRVDEAVVVKRIAMNPAGGRFTIRSDNSAYADWPDCDPATVAVIGRVVWAGRRIS